MFLQVFYVLVSDLLVDMHLILGLMTVNFNICSEADTSFYFADFDTNALRSAYVRLFETRSTLFKHRVGHSISS